MWLSNETSEVTDPMLPAARKETAEVSLWPAATMREGASEIVFVACRAEIRI